MRGQMCWLSQLGANGEKILHLQTAPINMTPYELLGNMLYQTPCTWVLGLGNLPKLMKAGWTLVPSARAQEFAIANTAAQVAKH